MRSLALFLALLATPATTLFGQFKMDAAGDPAPAGIPAGIVSALQVPGVKILNNSGQVFCQLWLMKAAPLGSTAATGDVTLTTLPAGSLIGVIRFPSKGADRRNQTIRSGTYLLRYVTMPVPGAAAPGTFAAMVPAGSDPGLSAQPSLEQVISMSTKVSHTGQPALLGLAAGSGKVTFSEEAGHAWTLNSKIGETPVAIIVAGKAEN